MAKVKASKAVKPKNTRSYANTSPGPGPDDIILISVPEEGLSVVVPLDDANEIEPNARNDSNDPDEPMSGLSDAACNPKACMICNRVFTQKRNMYQHMKRVHNADWRHYTYQGSNIVKMDDQEVQEMKDEEDELGEEPASKVLSTCTLCDREFTCSKNVYQHMRRIHKLDCVAYGSRRCPSGFCPFACRRQKDLRQHSIKYHGAVLKKDTLNFKSVADFRIWKEREERETRSTFVTDGSTKKAARTGIISYSFICHRAGTYNGKSTGKRKSRPQGTCKTGRWCTASIHVKEKENNLNVEYYSTHLGHRNELEYMKLSRKEKKDICEQLLKGLTIQQVIDASNIPSAEESASSSIAHYRKKLTTQDIQNIKREFEYLWDTDFESMRELKHATETKVETMLSLLDLVNYKSELSTSVNQCLDTCIDLLRDQVPEEHLFTTGTARTAKSGISPSVDPEISASLPKPAPPRSVLLHKMMPPVIVEFVQKDHNY